MPVARPLRIARSIAIQVTVAFCSLNPLLADAQMSCADWNTAQFFREARAHDVTHCIAAGSDPNLRGDAGHTPLHSAVASSTDPAVVARLLDAGADLESRGGTGLTPLHAAAGGNAVPGVVMALVNAGADLNARTEAGYTPLHAAATSSSVPAVVTALVTAGADLEARTGSGLTPLLVAARSSSEPAVVTALVNAGADLRARAESESGFTALHTAGDTKIESRMSIIGIMATAWYDIPIGAALVPYVGVGLGMVIRAVTAAVGDDTQSTSDTDIGAQGGVGVNVPLSTDLDLQLGYRIVAPLGDPSLQLFHNADVGVLFRL